MTDLLLQRNRDAWRRIGGLDTAEEIGHQPAVWRALAASIAAELERGAARIDAFLGNWLDHPAHRVILTGAGSSAYIGELVADELNAAWPARVRAIPSTSLLTHPELYLSTDRPTLLVSFARSGNSPESLAAVELLRARVPQARFLNITCNEAGALMRGSEGRADTLNLLMPAGSCDRGFAMTSSFSAMLLAALTVLGNAPWSTRLARIEALATAADEALVSWAPAVAALAAAPRERIVYLGSGPLEALAKEAALKVLELTSGQVLALANSPLGFRHGPKSALNAASLVVVFRSQEAEARRYEQDLIDEIRRDGIAAEVLDVGPAQAGERSLFSAATGALPDTWLAPLWLLMAQQYALHKSAALGLTPDNPFPDGTVNRVVQGVTIYGDARGA